MIGFKVFLKSIPCAQDSFKCKVALQMQNICSPTIGKCVYIGKIASLKCKGKFAVIELRDDFDFGWEKNPIDTSLRSDKRYWFLPIESLLIKEPNNILSTE